MTIFYSEKKNMFKRGVILSSFVFIKNEQWSYDYTLEREKIYIGIERLLRPFPFLKK